MKLRELFKRPFDLSLFAFLMPAAMLANFYAITPMRSWEYWWHLSVGRLIDYWIRIPAANHFAFAAPQELEIFNQPWASQWFLFVLHDVGGIELTLFMRNVLVVVALLGVTAVAIRRAKSVVGPALASLMATPFLFFAVDVGPLFFVLPLWAMLIAVGCYVYDARRLPGRRLWLLLFFPLAASLWANLAMGFIAPTLLAMGFATMALRQDEGRPIPFVVASLATLPAWLLTPHTTAIFDVLLTLDFASIIALVALLATPLIAPRLPPRLDALIAYSPRPLYAALITAALVVKMLAMQPLYPGQDELVTTFSPFEVRDTAPLKGRVPVATPVDCTERLYGTGKQLRLLHPPEHAGYLLYRLQDPRHLISVVTNLPAAAGVDHPSNDLYALTRDREVARGLIQQHGINAVIASPDTHAPLLNMLEADPAWYVLYEDGGHICFLRR